MEEHTSGHGWKKLRYISPDLESAAEKRNMCKARPKHQKEADMVRVTEQKGEEEHWETSQKTGGCYNSKEGIKSRTWCSTKHVRVWWVGVNILTAVYCASYSFLSERLSRSIPTSVMSLSVEWRFSSKPGPRGSVCTSNDAAVWC